MQAHSVPTTQKNATIRLLLRFLIYYMAAIPFGLMPLGKRAAVGLALFSVGKMQAIFLALALLGGVLTLTKPYLSVLSFFKGLYDTVVIYHLVLLVKRGSIGIFSWNACFFLIAFTAFLFLLDAAQAQCFSFFNKERDLKLLFSAAFGRYLILSLLYAAIAVTLILLWPQLCSALGISL